MHCMLHNCKLHSNHMYAMLYATFNGNLTNLIVSACLILQIQEMNNENEKTGMIYIHVFIAEWQAPASANDHCPLKMQ